MKAKETVSHFWIAAQPFFSTTLLIAPPFLENGLPIEEKDKIASLGSTGNSPTPSTESKEIVECVIYDVDGVKVNQVTVEFPATTVGVIQLEPFIAGLKLESGMQHGHVAVTARAGSKLTCRITSSNCAMQFTDPVMLRSRESNFIPLTLSNQREQMLVAVNAGSEAAQLTCRLFYGARSPEWNIVIPPNGSKVVSLHDDLLVSQDDRSWEKGALQSYLRLTSRFQGPVNCFAIERVPGETLVQDVYRTLSLA